MDAQNTATARAVESAAPAAQPAGPAPFLTVMVPVYNGEEYLADALRSILTQPCRDLEVLVLNDGSTDRTLAIAQDVAARDARVRVFSHPNVGIGSNRNGGFEHVRGRCLMFLDDDDVLLPNFYTEHTRASIGKLFDLGVEMIVPARLFANEGLTNAQIQRIPLEGVFPGASRASINLPYEFSTMIYSADLVEREHIRFCDIFPEMESIFRHKAVFCAPYVAMTNKLWYLVRRDNPTQLTKVWNVSQMLRVRAQEYARLVTWHKERGTTGEVLEEIERRAQEAKTENDAHIAAGSPEPEPEPKEGFFARRRRKRQEQRDYQTWVESMPSIKSFYYTPEQVAEVFDELVEEAKEAVIGRGGDTTA